MIRFVFESMKSFMYAPHKAARASVRYGGQNTTEQNSTVTKYGDARPARASTEAHLVRILSLVLDVVSLAQLRLCSLHAPSPCLYIPSSTEEFVSFALPSRRWIRLHNTLAGMATRTKSKRHPNNKDGDTTLAVEYKIPGL